MRGRGAHQPGLIDRPGGVPIRSLGNPRNVMESEMLATSPDRASPPVLVTAYRPRHRRHGMKSNVYPRHSISPTGAGGTGRAESIRASLTSVQRA